MTDTPPDVQQADPVKADLRREAGRRRKAAHAAAPADTAERLKRRFFDAIRVAPGWPVSGYWPIGSEIDPRAIMESLHRSGHPLGLPVVPGKDRPLLFRCWQPEMPLGRAGFGLSEPDESAGDMVPSLLLVPLLAFDRRGFRLGYGGGFYDRTLEKLRAADPGLLAVGLAYAGQEMATVPVEPTDQRLDWILTESDSIEIDTAGKGCRPLPEELVSGELAS